MATDNSGNAAITAATISAIGNYVGGVAANKRQFKFQKEAMAQQQQYNKDLWDYQNAYNTPQAQMERLSAAGLNPHLIYGGGSAMPGNAGPIASTDVPTREAAKPPEVSNAMFTYLQARQMDAQYKATIQNIDMAQKRGALLDIQTTLGNLKSMEQMARSKNFNDLASVELSTKRFLQMRANALQQNEYTKGHALDQTIHMRDRQIKGIELDNAFKANRNELAKLGIYQSDHPSFRILIQASKRMGIDLGELLAQGAEKLMYLLK